MIKKIISTALCIFVFTSFVSAKTEQQENSTTIVSKGTIEGVSFDSEITFDVYKHGKTYEDLLKGDFDVLAYRNEKTSKDGSYEFIFNGKNMTSGKYTVYVSSSGNDENPTTEDFLYVNPTEYKNDVKELNEYAKEDDYENFLICFNDNLYSLGFNEDDMSGLNEENIANLLFDIVKADNIDTEDITDSKDKFLASVVIESLNEGKSVNVFENAKALNLDSGELKNYYTKEYVDEEFAENVANLLKNSSITGLVDFNEKLKEAFILTVVSTDDGYGNIKEIMTEFEDEIGIKTSGVKDSVFSKIPNKTYSSYEELQDEFNDLKDEKITTGGGGSSGGGNKKGSSTVVSSVVPVENINNDKPNVMPMSIFTDIENVKWAEDAIIRLTEMGVLRGKEEGKFYPDDSITREEFVKMIVLAFNVNAENASCSFLDVDKNDWFYSYVAKASTNGIVKGISESYFGTGYNITREDLSVIAYRAALSSGKKFKESDTSSFSDDGDISDYAKEAVYAMKNAGVINGVTRTSFAPKNNATRAQAAKIIYLLTQM